MTLPIDPHQLVDFDVHCPNSAPLLVWRTMVEDRMLQCDLPGYADYPASGWFPASGYYEWKPTPMG